MKRRNFSTSMLLNFPVDYRTHPLYGAINWERVAAGHIAIVDPMDNAGILYLSEKDYRIQVRVSLSQDSPIVVLARPGDTNKLDDKKKPSSQNSPPRRINPTRVENPGEPLGPGQWDQFVESLSYEKLREKELKYGSLAEAFRASDLGAGSLLGPKKNFSSWSRHLQFHISSLSDLLGNKKGEKPLVTTSRENVMALILRWGLILLFRSGGSLQPSRPMRKAFAQMAEDFGRVLSTRGPQATIMKMKNTLFFLNRYLAGQGNQNPFHLGEPVGLAKSGLPRIIPLVIRRRLAAKDEKFIRIMTSLLTTYKVLEGTYERQTLGTILGRHPQIPQQDLDAYRKFCREIFWPHVKKLARDQGKNHLATPNLAYRKGVSPYIPLRAGPNSDVGLLGAHLDLIAWDLCPVNYPLEWAKLVKDETTLNLMSRCLEYSKAMLEHPSFPVRDELDTGRIALLYEPAGKVRPIALVDYWTQRLMYPVHQWMMGVLSLLPGDGTFNQEQAVKSYASLFDSNAKHWSIDLKSATDLIPTELYRILFSEIWTSDEADLWINLLTDRWFRLPREDSNLAEKLQGKVVQYGRGQPMGTLSSWASMALVHHSVVLFSAWNSKRPMSFEYYRVLGDDLVIGDEAVALNYQEVTTKLRIPTSPAKTLEGKLFIFASQIYCEGVNVSPLSLKEEIGVKSFSQRLEVALRAVSRGWLADHPSVCRFLRFMLSQKDYCQSVKSWYRGSLGRKAQAALISAFGVGQRCLASLGFLRESQCVPFLLAMQDKVEALVGDQSSLERRSKDLEQVDLELSLATAIVQRARRRAGDMVKDLDKARLHFMEMSEGFSETGVLVRSRRKGPVASLPNLPYRNDPLPFWDFPDLPYSQFHDAALWPVIEDSYAASVGVFKHSSDMTDYDIAQSEDWVDHEDLGMGVTFHSEDSMSSTPFEYGIPRVIEDSQASKARIQEIMDKVSTTVASQDIGFDLWELVDEAFLCLAKIPRLPSFETLDSLRPDRSPKAKDLRREWVRQIKEYDTVLRYLPMYAKLAAMDVPEVSVSLDEEALLSYRPFN